MTIDVVLARYKEDVTWTERLHKDIKLHIYNKGPFLIGPNVSFYLTDIPNVGREAHTYLHHIIANYASLAEWTFFSQADPRPHCHNLVDILKDWPDTCRKSVFLPEEGVYFFYDGPVRFNRGTKDHEDWESGVSQVFEELFWYQAPEDFLFAPASIFAISREKLLSRTLAFYKRCMNLAVTRERGPWEFERIWGYLWRDKDKAFVKC